MVKTDLNNGSVEIVRLCVVSVDNLVPVTVRETVSFQLASVMMLK